MPWPIDGRFNIFNDGPGMEGARCNGRVTLARSVSDGARYVRPSVRYAGRGSDLGGHKPLVPPEYTEVGF